MSLLEDLEAEFTKEPSDCKVGAWLDTLEQASRDQFVDATYRVGRGTTKSGLFRVAEKNGYRGSENTLRRHIRTDCGCEQ